MDRRRNLRIILGTTSLFLFLLLLAITFSYFRLRRVIRRRRSHSDSPETGGSNSEHTQPEELVAFAGGEHLRAQDILDAPGEVVGNSSYGTLYRATVRITGGGGAAGVFLLRFVRPACVGSSGDILPAVCSIGSVRHWNLVPLTALYVGPMGEKLFVHPFYGAGNLTQLLKETTESTEWEIIHKLSIGIARGLDHLHNGLEKPLIHGNLKSKNVLLDEDLRPLLSDFGLHLLLNPTAAQELLEAAAAEGYKAPELMKMKEASKETDIYNLGIVFLELLTRKEASSCRLMALERKVLEVVNGGKEVFLLKLCQLALACCSPAPALRPDIKHVIRTLEEIGR